MSAALSQQHNSDASLEALLLLLCVVSWADAAVLPLQCVPCS
jgi:hypothetical protein